MAGLDLGGFEAKAKALRKALAQARERAGRDAAKLARTQVGRDVRATLNVGVSQVNARLKIGTVDGLQALRISYAPLPATAFSGWTYRAGSDVVRARGTRAGRRAASAKTQGLKVKFHRGQPALRFARAFTHGAAKFYQRETKATPRLPIRGLFGPSIQAEALVRFDQHVAHGRAGYDRRLKYWTDRLTQALR